MSKIYTLKEYKPTDIQKPYNRRLVATLDSGIKVFETVDYCGLKSLLLVCSKKVKISDIIYIKISQPFIRILVEIE